jgi:murein DD-endopeptidase MepM/ murein hydrolase activator NlpD
MRLRVVLACVIGCALVWAWSPLPSSGQSLDRIQDRIDATRGKIGRKKGTERVLAADISSYTRRINRLQSRISRLGHREVVLQADLDRKKAELLEIQADLRRERARLLRLRKRLVVARRALARRLVELYRSDQPDLVTVVLKSDGFAELLERGEFLRRISDADREIVTVVRAARRDAKESAERLADLEQRQQRVAAAVLRRRDEVRGVKNQLVGTRVGYARTREDKQSALVKVRDDRQNLEGHLTVLESKAQEIQAKLAAVSRGSNRNLAAGPVKRGSGSMVWPVNGPVTSPFCERRSWESCHPGVDIGVPSGTPIRAADGGRVVLIQSTGSSGGYGNFTCLQHSGALQTCYAHQSSIGVSMGQSVSQGQTIGSVGCTGRCFGDHLHFEVRINGAVTNPMNYL